MFYGQLNTEIVHLKIFLLVFFFEINVSSLGFSGDVLYFTILKNKIPKQINL